METKMKNLLVDCYEYTSPRYIIFRLGTEIQDPHLRPRKASTKTLCKIRNENHMHFPEPESGVRALGLKEYPKNTRFKFGRRGKGNRVTTGALLSSAGCRQPRSLSVAEKGKWLSAVRGLPDSFPTIFLLLLLPLGRSHRTGSVSEESTSAAAHGLPKCIMSK